MENLQTAKYISKTVVILVDEGHSYSEHLKKTECSFCTQSVWCATKGLNSSDPKKIECYCLKTNTLKWNDSNRLLITHCDGFTDKPLSTEE